MADDNGTYTEDVYVLQNDKTGEIYAIADDFEYLNMKTADYSAEEQKDMVIKNHDLIRVEGD